ncbi:MAG: pilus assembly protein [Planctomycetales bacterium]|nr:pilus assembly protein [Planctomycetales bacterium]
MLSRSPLRTCKCHPDKAPGRRGAVTVEFAVTAPILFLLLVGSLELGHANMVFNTVESAAYEGARAGIVIGAQKKDCTLAAEAVLKAAGVRNASIQVSMTSLTTQVSIKVPYKSNTVVTPFFSKGLVVERACELSRD